MEIVIIDDGVNEDCFRIGTLKHNLEVLDTLEIVKRRGYDTKASSHGSICAGIIKKYAPNCEIGSIKVTDPQRHNGMNSQLLSALKWCAESNVQLINMSLGSIDFRDYEEMKALIARLLRNQCIIVAACHNGDYYTVPACLSGVICVASDPSFVENQFIMNENYLERVDIYASSQHLLHDYDNQEIFTPLANSYAAPLVSSMAWGVLQDTPCKKVCEVKKALKNKQIVDNKKNLQRKKRMQNKKNGWGYSVRADFIDTAILLNYSAHIESESFCFQVSKWHEKPDLENLILDMGYHNLIILPPSMPVLDSKLEQDIFLFMKKHKNNINGLLYAGIMPPSLQRACEEEVNCLIWDEASYQRLLQEFKASCTDCNIPVISIEGQDEAVLRSISLLEKEFYNDHYHVVKASAIKDSYLYGVEYIPNTIVPMHIFQYWEERYENNLVLFAGDTSDIEEIDMQIILKEEPNVIQWDGERIIISESLFHVNIKEVYQYIIKCFVEYEAS